MNAFEMMSALDDRDARRKAEDEKLAAKQKSDMLLNVHKANKLLGKVLDVRDVVERLIRDGHVKGHGFFGHSLDFVSDGIEHGLGFMRVNGYIDFNLFGIQGNGAWYNSVCVNIENGMWSQHSDGADWDEFMSADRFVENSHTTYVNYRPVSIKNYADMCVSEKVAKIANGIDKFVADVEAFVVKITKGTEGGK